MPTPQHTTSDPGDTHTHSHRHGSLVHSHPHTHPAGLDHDAPNAHDHLHDHDHDRHSHDDQHHPHAHRDHEGPGHSHGLVDRSIVGSRDGVRTVAISLAVLAAVALVQAIIFVASGSVALLADMIHNFGDALTAIPLGIAFLLRSYRAEKIAGL